MLENKYIGSLVRNLTIGSNYITIDDACSNDDLASFDNCRRVLDLIIPSLQGALTWKQGDILEIRFMDTWDLECFKMTGFSCGTKVGSQDIIHCDKTPMTNLEIMDALSGIYTNP